MRELSTTRLLQQDSLRCLIPLRSKAPELQGTRTLQAQTLETMRRKADGGGFRVWVLAFRVSQFLKLRAEGRGNEV